jgi:hypothetical protein
MKNIVLPLICLVASVTVGVSTGWAQVAKSVDARTVFSITPAKQLEHIQELGFMRTMTMRNDAAQAAFGDRPERLTLSNFPLPTTEQGTLVLKRTSAVFDANTEFISYEKNGPQRVKVTPVTSYRGYVDGDPSSMVSLHYSNGGSLVGVIQHAGRRILLDRNLSERAKAAETPLVVGDEQALLRENPLSNFLCGSDEKSYSDESVRRALETATPSKPVEFMQEEDLRELNLAVVLKEDLDVTMKSRGFNDEQIFQYFATIIACMNQTYEEEMSTRFYIGHFRKYTTDNPSPYFSDGTDPGALLEEFSQDWAQNNSSGATAVQRDLAHLFTLIRPVNGGFIGGIAYGGGGGPNLCNNTFRGSYAVSTVYVNANTELPGRPTVANAFTWDYFVIAHEIGHNIGAWHTHNCAWGADARDTCQLQRDGTDACFNNEALRRVRPGTIMSYCHLVNGSTTPFTFGRAVAARMRTWIERAACARKPTQPVLEITSPRGQQAFIAGSKMQIRWSSARVSNVRLEYRESSEASWTTIVPSVPAADRLYEWTIPPITASELIIRAIDPSQPTVGDTTLASYSIQRSISVTNPSGGERLPTGSTFQIRWTRTSTVPSVHLEFSTNGTTWERLASNLTETQFQWTVPNASTELARIRVVSSANAELTAESGDFSIGQPRFQLILPRSTDSLCNNQENQFRWSGDFIQNIRIQFSINGGANWQNAISVLNVPVASGQVFSVGSALRNVAAGTLLSLRVVATTDANTPLATLDGLRVAQCGDVSSADADEVGDIVVETITLNGDVAQARIVSPIQTMASFDVVAMDGTIVRLKDNAELQAGTPTIVPMSVASLPSGAYRVVVRSGTTVATYPLSIAR